MSFAKNNLSTCSEEHINSQINSELTAAYTYASCASFFARDSVALHGMSEYFKEGSKICLEKAAKILEYMNLRSGKIVYRDISAPQEWDNVQKIFTTALDIERHLYSNYWNVCKAANESHDPELEDFVQGVFMKKQCENIKEIADLCTTLSRVGPEGIGLYMLDREIADRLGKKHPNSKPKTPKD